jgi:hypothetical protein
MRRMARPAARPPPASARSVPDTTPPRRILPVLARGHAAGKRAGGASWSEIGAALGISKQAAWQAHSQWIEDQAEQHRRDGVSGTAPDIADAARRLAGEPGTED